MRQVVPLLLPSLGPLTNVCTLRPCCRCDCKLWLELTWDLGVLQLTGTSGSGARIASIDAHPYIVERCDVGLYCLAVES
jgi:hypothetical protein